MYLFFGFVTTEHFTIKNKENNQIMIFRYKNLNKKWKADWGGNLCILDGEKFENIQILVPEYNSINIMTSKRNKKKSPHFVTSVEKFAKEPRFSITIFLY